MGFRFFPRLVLDLQIADFFTLLFQNSTDESDNTLLDRSLAKGRPFATSLSVRTAFDLLLQEIGIRPGDEIIMSAATIPSMAEIARSHGLRIRAAAIDPQTLIPKPEEIGRLIGPRTRIVLVAPLFGVQNDLEPLIKVCRKQGIFFIEDAAQSFDGQYGGSESADAVLFSFGPVKTATALGGAVVILRDAALAERFIARQQGYPALPVSWLWVRAAKFAVLRLLNHPLALGAGVRLVTAFGYDADQLIANSAHGFRADVLIDRIRHRLPNRMRHLMAKKINNCRGTGEREDRAARFALYLGTEIMLPGAAARHNARWMTTVSVSSPLELVGKLRSAGFDATRGASNIKVIGDDVTGGTPAETAALLSSLVYVPITRYTSEQQIRTMADIVRKHCSGS